MSGSKFIPNSFQTPNIYVDEFMAYLTDAQLRVLIYTVRRILGFQKRQDRISLSQYSDGLTSRDGTRLDRGCGISSRKTVANALQDLIRFGLIIKVAENDPARNEGAEYSLQLDSDLVNMEELEKQLLERQETGRKRMQVALKKRSEKLENDREGKERLVPLTAVSPTNHPRLVPLTAPGKSDLPGLVSPTTTQNPVLNPVGKPEEKIPISENIGLPVNGNNSKTANQAWKSALDTIKGELGQKNFDQWVKPALLIDYNPIEGIFIVMAPNNYGREWLEGRLKSTFIRVLTGICNRSVEVLFTEPPG